MGPLSASLAALGALDPAAGTLARLRAGSGGLDGLELPSPSGDPTEGDGAPLVDIENPVGDGPCNRDDDTVCGWLFRRTGDQDVAEVLDFVIGTPLFVLLVVVVAFLVRWLAHRGIRHAVEGIVSGERRRGRLDTLGFADPLSVARRGQRAKAVGSLLRAGVSVVVWTVALFVILPELGVEIAGLLAGAGIIGVAVAFGAQSLVADLVSGIFMIAEDQYGVGDVIDMGEATGVVESVGLRTTRLRSVDGTVWHVRNGEVIRVGNMSQGWSRALLDIEVAYSEDVSRVMDILKRIGHELREDPDFGAKFLDEPEMWGVEAFSANSVVIRMIIKTKPLEQWTVAREMRRRIKYEFDRLGVEIPFPQRSVWIRSEGPEGEDAGDGPVPDVPRRPAPREGAGPPPPPMPELARGEATQSAEDAPPRSERPDREDPRLP